jgi:AraC-like DNA-binding protein
VRRETGRSFTELLTAYRMQMACRLLLESNIPVYQISEIVGYQSLEHFNRTFKAQKGMPPSEYRRKNKK